MIDARSNFRKKTIQALANQNLQIALDNNAARRRSGRLLAIESLSENIDKLREQAREIRLDVIQNLDLYLAQFAEQIRKNGFIVHWAADSSDATQKTLEIINNRGGKVVAKSKSMVSEEIHLNKVLEENGIKVVETDLGEFIVQIRNEPPAHIITPAVHLRREDVAQTFHENFGMPLTDDIRVMTDVAYHELRNIFLNADVGISGVNFGIAESGTICLLTNEGNGRMVTTLPPVHIALMGIERILPKIDDLAIFLKLLPRSATGQKLTSYVSLINSPRRDQDPDGPQERHLILIDNRRKQIASSPLAEMLHCIRCGACLNACPVFQEIGGHVYQSPYPGPIGSILSPALFGIEAYGHLSKASSLCGACTDACPVMIDFPTLLLRTREQYIRSTKQSPEVSIAMRSFSYISSSPSRYRTALRALSLASEILNTDQNWYKQLPPPLSAWTNTRNFPAPAKKIFRDQWKHIRQSPNLEPKKFFAVEKEYSTNKNTLSSAFKNNTTKELVEKFSQELHSLGSKLILCKSENLQEKLTAELVQLKSTKLLIWDELPGLPDVSIAKLADHAGCTILSSKLLQRNPARREGILWLSQADTGITGAIAAFADTGTIVVKSGKNLSQLASLLPANHIILLPRSKLFPSFDDWQKTVSVDEIRDNQCLSFISGPSRTADIEMTLTIGVHGPSNLTIICVDKI
jgi:L-lactate dehydrogenase complex protein LldF